MSAEMTDQEPKKSRMRGVFTTILYFGLVAALVVVLYAVLPNGSDDADQEAVAETTTTSTSTTLVDEVNVDAPAYMPGEEPIADAAEIILPSVVHIQTQGGIGAGVVYDSEGLIITAAHVVEGSDNVTVRLYDGDIVDGEVLGADSVADIAVIEIERSDLEAAGFNESPPRVGQMAIAIGSPWNLDSTVTAGIVSAINQTNCEFEACVAMVQTDAAINPGNSGGPLVDRHGDVIGINVSIFTNSGENAGVGFAVPTSTALAYAESIVSGEVIEAGFLGVLASPALENQAGAVIEEVYPGTAAAEAGIEVGDVIVGLDGVEILSSGDLSAQMRTHRPGDEVAVELIRDGEEMLLVATLGERPDDLN